MKGKKECLGNFYIYILPVRILLEERYTNLTNDHLQYFKQRR